MEGVEEREGGGQLVGIAPGGRARRAAGSGRAAAGPGPGERWKKFKFRFLLRQTESSTDNALHCNGDRRCKRKMENYNRHYSITD